MIYPWECISHTIPIRERLREYRAHTIALDQIMSYPDKDNPLANLRYTEPLGIEQSCFNDIATGFERREDFLEIALGDPFDESRDILRNKGFRLKALE